MQCQKEENLKDCPCSWPNCPRKGYIVSVSGIIGKRVSFLLVFFQRKLKKLTTALLKCLLRIEGSEKSVVRGQTSLRLNIWGVELMKNELSSKVPNIISMEIDSYLWLKNQEKSPEDKPYHLTKTIFY